MSGQHGGARAGAGQLPLPPPVPQIITGPSLTVSRVPSKSGQVNPFFRASISTPGHSPLSVQSDPLGSASGLDTGTAHQTAHQTATGESNHCSDLEVNSHRRYC